MGFPLTLSDISLWLAFAAIILLITSELLISLPEYSGRFRIGKKNLRLVALGCGLSFLVTVVLRIVRPF
jgi:hypothetical protein